MTTSDHTLLVGSYGKSSSRHLYRCVLDGQTGHFVEAKPWATAEQSSYLTQTADGKVLSLIRTEHGSGLALFSKQGRLLSQVLDQPVPACHLTYWDKEGLVLTANYHTGQVTAYQLTEHDRLETVQQLDFGVNSQPHFVGPTTDGFILVVLMGQDRIVAYDKTWQEVARYDLPPGTRPRHLVFHNSKKMVYLVGEGDNQVHTLFYDGLGEVELYQSLATLPDDAQENSWAGAICLSPDGRFLYITNRGHNSLTCFAVAADGCLSFVENRLLEAKNPRDLALTPAGDFLLIACPDSNQLISSAIDPEKGTLRVCDQTNLGEAVSVLVQNP